MCRLMNSKKKMRIYKTPIIPFKSYQERISEITSSNKFRSRNHQKKRMKKCKNHILDLTTPLSYSEILPPNVMRLVINPGS